MRILVLQHLAVEHPGIFRTFFEADGFVWETVELDEGNPIPDLAPYDMMLVMGGPQDVWQEDKEPWLKTEKAAIHEFVVGMKRPFLGICLGHQLLAEAVGGKVELSKRPEVGVLTVTKTPAGRTDKLLEGVADTMAVLQWHGAEVVGLPSDAIILAASTDCAIQAFRYGRHAYGMQFHVEITNQTVDDWGVVPAYACALETTMGQGALDSLRRTVGEKLPQFNRDASVIYANLKQIVAAAR